MKKLFYQIVALFTALFTTNFSANADAFSSTILLEARQKIADRLQMYEQRKNVSKIVDCAIKSTSLSAPVLEASKDLQTAKLTYIKNKLFTEYTTRTCSPVGEQAGSGIASVSFVHREVRGYVSKSQAGVNDFDYTTQLANLLLQLEQSLFVRVDSYMATQLASLVSTVNAADGQPNSLNVSTMEVANADIKRFYSLIASDMANNNYDGIGFYDIANTAWKATHNGNNFGAYTNLLDKPEDNGVEQFFSNTLSAGNYSSLHYIIPEGGLYYVQRIPDMYDGEIRGTEQKLKYESKLHPGMMLELTIVKSCADTSSDGGQLGDSVDTFVLGTTFAFGSYPLSAAGETLVYKYATLNA